MKTSSMDTLPEFRVLAGREPEATASAPGRVNLIGEHTDYNGGHVLPMAIAQRTHVELAARDDEAVRVWSAQRGSDRGSSYQLGCEARRRDWLDYVQGLTHVLSEERFALRGFDLRITSEVPLGSGLSSSAALEVAVLRGLRGLLNLQLDDVTLALLAHRAENNFVGAKVGILDQMACSLADDRAALFLDTRSLRHERVELPASCVVAVINSGIAHRHATGGYNARRRECEQAASALGVAYLTDLTLDELPRLAELPEPLRRRARHVITEHYRVRQTVEALRRDDLAEVGRLFRESHLSMRDDYEVSIPEIDAIVQRAWREPAMIGARLTGGGFGGSVVTLVRGDEGRAAARRVAEAYAAQFHKSATVL